MTLFNFFKSRKDIAEVPSLPALQTTPVVDNLIQKSESESVDTSTPASAPLTVSYATGWPIDLIYGYLHKNYEEKGYSDAMLNSNLTFRDMNMSIIRNKILMIFREVNLKYSSMKRDLDTRIETCNAAGLLTTVAELEKQLSVIVSHKNELAKLEEDFRINANEASVPLMSYECGFLRGVSAIAMSTPSKAPAVPEVSMPSFFTANRETA
ncbi:MAG: hypothetical protein K2L45_05020 [Muribaculaceae bacterium]|nr:hypothetical protein [Muribaculaceae bacterium]